MWKQLRGRWDVTRDEEVFVASHSHIFHPDKTFREEVFETKKHSRGVTRLYGCGRIWGCSSLRQKKPRGSSRGAYWHTTFSGALVQKTWCRGEPTRTDHRVSPVFERHPLRLRFFC